MAHIGNYLPSPGSAVWRRDVATSPTHGHGGSVASQSENVIIRHVVIRDAQIWEEPAPYVVSILTVCYCSAVHSFTIRCIVLMCLLSMTIGSCSEGTASSTPYINR